MRKEAGEAGGGRADGEEASDLSAKPDEEDQSADNDDLYYFSKQESAYKVFDPRTKLWTAQPGKPSVESIRELRAALTDARQEEQNLIDEIHLGIAGAAPTGSPTLLERRDSSAAAEQIASLAAQSVLKKVSSTEPVGEEEAQAGEDNGKPMTAEELRLKELKKLKKKRYMENKKRKWYQTKVNNYIYIQGLPNDITEPELKEYFIRCGVLRLDPFTGKEQIKLYLDDSGVPKGDARIGYMMEESVYMALDMLNETEIRPGYKITVELAEFQ